MDCTPYCAPTDLLRLSPQGSAVRRWKCRKCGQRWKLATLGQTVVVVEDEDDTGEQSARLVASDHQE